jgi:hypothetical protein
LIPRHALAGVAAGDVGASESRESEIPYARF